MSSTHSCRHGRVDRVSRFERRMLRLARVVRAVFVPWDEVPPAWRRVAIVVVLQLLGLLPPAAVLLQLAR
jgi:hypothetical protein